MVKKESVSIDEMKNIFKRIIDFKKWEIDGGFVNEISESVAYILYEEMMSLEKFANDYIDKYVTADDVDEMEEEIAEADESSDNCKLYHQYHHTTIRYIDPPEYGWDD